MTSHPIDPITAAEIDAVTAVLARDHGVGAGWRITSMAAVEPPKADVASYEAGQSPAPPRRARVVALDRGANLAHVAVVTLSGDSSGGGDLVGAVESWEAHPGVQPNVTVDEWTEADAMLRSHPGVVAALAARGITDLDLVFMDTWTYGGALVPPQHAGRRLGWSDTWVKRETGANPYAGPVGGLHCVVDLGSMELLEIEDTPAPARPEVMGEYVPSLVPERIRSRSRRPPVVPLDVVQPDGPGFTVNGQLVQWQGWSLRVGFNHREGLTLHRITYQDGDRTRSIANKLSFAEMVVPYRDPSVDHYRRTAFDIGEWGLGFMTTSLELGCDCLGEIRYLDATLHDSQGRPTTIRNAVCLHEEDDAILWKHVDHDEGAEVRRSRRFVVSCHVTVANYEYLVYWRFYQDGTIECEVRATGIMVVTHLAEGQPHPHGTLVDQRTYAPFHQHFLVARLDLDVDGPANTVVRSETRALPIGPDNPYGLALVQDQTPIETEGYDDMSWETQRGWKVVNERATNGVGTHPAYKLVPGGAIPPMFPPGSPLLERAGVISHAVWVTPNDPEQRWPSGEFVNQSIVDHGLPEWVEAGRPTRDTDVVLWYVFGIHHVTRPEDWPVMPSDIVRFELKPFGFFDRNPSLDVAPPPGGHCSA